MRDGMRVLESGRPIVAHVCGDPPVALHASQQISSESWVFLGVAAVSRYTPLKSPVAPVTLQLPGVSHVKLPLQRCRGTRGCSSYTGGCRATLCNYGQPQNAQKVQKEPPGTLASGIPSGRRFGKGLVGGGCWQQTGPKIHKE